MKLLRLFFFGSQFRDLEQTIKELREIRDSYRALNVEIYGKELARMLNDM